MEIDGIPVVDATEKIQISISPQDVKQGRKRNPDACAAALACARQIDGAVAAKVYRSTTYIQIRKGKKLMWVRYRTPNSIRTELVGFDRGGTFEAGDYMLSPVQPAHRFGARPAPAGGHEHKTKRPPPHITTNIRALSPYRGT